ncbi:CBS domain-containing protein [Streptomyces hesseae]|uniref:CBS domain-containing protein n=1 Tax=Streptomyces hesseae TaxID=3075519 RepID=A0ABU2SP30_9ACTN|nr:CBS domain-containing protein [Streptomyces sp. DSM 40473]MDT0449550.1 CBS domain-containing protein [Streptomyces sp. DSM 40473]
MEHRTVDELMTRNVIRVRADTPFKAIVRELTENDVTTVPVVDGDGRVVGVVSEADLMRKPAGLPDPFGLLPLPDTGPADRAKAAGARADELMTAPPVCARPGWNVVETARLMATRNVKFLPVADETLRLLGIITRSDVLRVYLRDDAAIRSEIERDLLQRTMRLGPSAVTAVVSEGQVTLTGTVESENRSMIPVIERLCRSVDGVVSVHQRISYAGRTGDDTEADSPPVPGRPLRGGADGPGLWPADAIA